MGSACTRGAVQVAVLPDSEVVPTAKSPPAAWSEPEPKKPGLGQELAGLAAEIARPPQKVISIARAVKKNDLKTVRELLADGADVDQRGMFGNTPLISACAEGYAALASLLIAAKADVAAKNEQGACALHFAAAEGLEDVCAELVRHGADVHAGSPKAGIYHRHLDGYFAVPPLVAAAQSGFPTLVALLLEHGADVNEVSAEGGTALWRACRSGQASCVRVLLAAGATLDAEGMSCVEAACSVQGPGDKKTKNAATLAVLKVLLEEAPSGLAPDVNASGAPLVDCVASGNDSASALLLTHGCKVNSVAADGRTALHAACSKMSKPMIELLLAHRADCSARDGAGATPRELLVRLGAPEPFVALLEPAEATQAGTGEAC